MPQQINPEHNVVDILTGQPPLDDLVHSLDSRDSRRKRNSSIVGSLLLAGGVLIGAGFATGDIHFEESHQMPFIEVAQHGVNNIDNVLEVAGEIGFTASLLTIGTVKMRSRSGNPRFKYMDEMSKKEPTSDESRDPGFVRKIVRGVLAGKRPISGMAAAAVGLAAFSSSVSTEVSNGPQRPIVTALTELTPGNQMVVGYAGAMPMIESDISRPLANSVIRIAAKSKIRAGILDENLGQLTRGSETLSDLSLGTDVPENSLLHWNEANGCQTIPVGVDSLGDIADGRTITVNGVEAIVVEQFHGLSATNRIGIEMDENAMATCLKKDPMGPVHSVVLDGSAAEAQAILKEADTNDETAVVISKDHYLQNSKTFWEANVKPITNVLALFSGLFAFVAMGGAMRERLIKNRRELAAKSASGQTDGMIRKTELLRAAKDGVVATIVGNLGALATPFVVNTLESGFKAGISGKDMAVGAAVGVFGTAGGALKSLIRPQKTINTIENTRV